MKMTRVVMPLALTFMGTLIGFFIGGITGNDIAEEGQGDGTRAVDYMLLATQSAYEYSDTDKAIAYANRAVAVGKEWYETHATLGEMYEKAGNSRMALEAYQHALALVDNENSSLYQNEGVDKQFLAEKVRALQGASE